MSGVLTGANLSLLEPECHQVWVQFALPGYIEIIEVLKLREQLVELMLLFPI